MNELNYYYLNKDSLNKGLDHAQADGGVNKAFTMYFKEFISGVTLNDEVIRIVFEYEMFKIAKPKTYMGIWQTCALSSVLHMPIFSVYPALGNPHVRADLHKYVEPRVDITHVTKAASPVDDTEEPALVIMCYSTQNKRN